MRSKKKREAESNLPARERLLVAALREFGEKGFAGARVEKITRDAKANKQLVYHYFGNKEALFKSVLERAYREYTGDALRLSIESADAKTALRLFVDTMFRPSSATVYFNQILQDENRFGARHVKPLRSVKQTYVEVINLVRTILAKGEVEGVFRRGIDPREFYISLVGLFNLRTVNAKTLGAAIGVPLDTKAGMARSRAEAFDLILHGIGR
jgi:TetR/AcrR family transcriptional regulator